jgi:hypothetical protein
VGATATLLGLLYSTRRLRPQAAVGAASRTVKAGGTEGGRDLIDEIDAIIQEIRTAVSFP